MTNEPLGAYDREGLIARLAAAVLAVDHARSLPMQLEGPVGPYTSPEYVRAWRVADQALAIARAWLAEYSVHA